MLGSSNGGTATREILKSRTMGNVRHLSPVLTGQTLPGGHDPLIVRLLGTIKKLDPDRLTELWQSQSQADETVEESMIRGGLADERQIAEAYASHYLLPLFDPPGDAPPPVDPNVAAVLSAGFCRLHRIAPLSDDGQTLEVALFAPESLLLADEIRQSTGRQMRPLFAPLSVVERLLDLLYVNQMPPPEPISPPAQTRTKQKTANSRRRVDRYIDRLVAQACQAGASDVHLEIFDDRWRIRLRVGRTLTEIQPPSRAMLTAAMQRIKVLAKLQSAPQDLQSQQDLWPQHDPRPEHAAPQQGVLEFRQADGDVVIRVTTCPSIGGERIVLRIHDQAAVPCELSRLGFEPSQLDPLFTAIDDATANDACGGLVLLSGPAGCGKSTTLAAILRHLNNGQRNLCSVEDTVEFKISGVTQVQTNAASGRTVATVVESFLRQDADVIAVGELRDREAAEACLRAAATGRLVLAGVPAGDALSGLMHLREMGISSPSLAHTVCLLMAQRLCRRGSIPQERIPALETVRVGGRLARLIRAGADLETLREAADQT